MSQKIKILYIDKEQNNLNAFMAYFRRKESFAITTSLKIEEKHIIDSIFNVLIIDHGAIKEECEDVLDRLIQNGVNSVKIVVTAYRNVDVFESYLRSGELYDCLHKPIDFDHLGSVIERGHASHFK